MTSRSKDAALAKATAQAAKSESSATSSPSIAEEKPLKPGKYDVSRIGQRSVGHGLNMYSLQKERALGEALAAQVDRGARFIDDAETRDYIKGLARKNGAYDA